MPVSPTYPGVYIEEVPSGVRTITGVATSITAFLGRALRGPTNKPVRIQSFGDFENIFGGLWVESALGYALQQYFLNGGSDAIVVRIAASDAAAAKKVVQANNVADAWNFTAAAVGKFGNNIQLIIDHETRDPGDTKLFNLTVNELDGTKVVSTESYRNVSSDPNHPRWARRVLTAESNLVQLTADSPDRPDKITVTLAGGADGKVPTLNDLEGTQSKKTGLYALENADLFNLLSIPPLDRSTAIADTDAGLSLLSKAAAYCSARRAILLIDPPSSWKNTGDVTDSTKGVDGLKLRSRNSALYFPPIKMADPLRENRLESFAPSAAVAGVIARTDAERGVWKAPAGQDAVLFGARGLDVNLTDGEQGQLNPLAVNCLRSFPVIGNVVWGARTLDGADRLSSEWKYLPIRRLALFIEESLFRGTKWVVFEPNDEPLWAQIRLNLNAFMQDLFRQGAFQGSSPRDAYFVKCDAQTTTQSDRDRGIVNIQVGFAPLKPAEFVIIKLQQMANQGVN